MSDLTAPVQKGTVVGEIVYLAGDTLLYREEIVTAETVERIDFSGVLRRYAVFSCPVDFFINKAEKCPENADCM